MPSNRREMLKHAGRLAAAAALASASSQLSSSEPPRKFKFVIAGGHPGDPEYGCGGTIARLTSLGHEVLLLYLNDGAWETSSPVRIAEARKACEILKARPVWAGQANGHSVVDDAHYAAFRKIIETESPDAVFNHWPIDNHPDHRAVANLMYESWNQLKRRFPMYYYEVSSGEDTMQFPAPTHFVEITSTADTKKAACYAHASQNPAFFYQLQDSVAHFRGIESGHDRAEAFAQQIGSPWDIFPLAGLSPSPTPHPS